MAEHAEPSERRPGVSRLVVIGVGDPNRHDDGVGIAVVNRLRLRARHARPRTGIDLGPPASLAEVRFAVSNGEATRLVDLWGDAAVAIVVNCVHTPRPIPGRVHRRSLLHPSLDGRRVASSHGAALSNALALSSSLDRLPGAVVLYAVEPGDISPGRGLTPAVAAAAAEIAEEITTDFIPA
jgi:hydrogenase maturation protease